MLREGRPCHRHAEAGALLAGGEERRPHALEHLGWHAAAGVAHFDPRMSDALDDAYLDAAAARRQRAEVKDKLKIGSLTVSELFDAADTKDGAGEMLAKLKVVSVLESLPGVGKVRARNIMSELEISESRRLRGLGANQRRALLDKFA